MPHKGEHQTLTKQSMQKLICPDETMLMSRGSGNCYRLR